MARRQEAGPELRVVKGRGHAPWAGPEEGSASGKGRGHARWAGPEYGSGSGKGAWSGALGVAWVLRGFTNRDSNGGKTPLLLVN